MSDKKWGSLKLKTKLGAIFLALGCILQLIFTIAFIDDYYDTFAFVLDLLPFDYEAVLIIFAIVFTVLDLLVVWAIVRHKQWACKTGVLWGLWGLSGIVSSIMNDCVSGMIVVYGLFVLAGILLFFTKKSDL